MYIEIATQKICSSDYEYSKKLVIANTVHGQE